MTQPAKTPSVEPVVRSRLLPRVSFRMMFAITTVSAILAAVARSAGNGSQLAGASAGAAGFIVQLLMVGVVCFLIAWAAAFYRALFGGILLIVGVVIVLPTIVASMLRILPNNVFWLSMFTAGFCIVVGATLYLTRRPLEVTAATSPFAADQLPPQILPPREQPK